MHKINSPGHDNNQFVDEDPNNAISGTILSASWLNTLQEELINILVLAGITPSEADDDQLAAAFILLGGSKEWADILNKPSTFNPSSHTHSYASITSKPSTFNPSSHTHSYASITSKPSTFNPSSHTHAIYALVSDFVKSHAQSGYQKFPEGLIIQWNFSIAGSVLFPIAFPNNVFIVNATRDSTGSTDNPSRISSLTFTSFTLSHTGYWIAIGY